MIAGGALAVGSGEAVAASTTVFACYSNTTDALQYLKPPATTCPTGTTLLSWSQTGPQGPQGPQGAKGFNSCGAWSSTTAYAVGDVVGYSGASWIAKVANTGSTPAISNTNWFTVAARGAVGAPGAQGAQGAAGAQGAQGKTGSGAQGVQGPAGPQGAQGTTGATGPQGKTGAAGPQGAAGAQGATGATGGQGPAGAVSGDYLYDTTEDQFPTSVVTTVAAFAPATSGPYAVTATTNLDLPPHGLAECYLAIAYSTRSSTTAYAESTPYVHDDNIGSVDAPDHFSALTNTGVLSAPVRQSGEFVERCLRYDYGSSHSGFASDTQITATRLSRGFKETLRMPRNRFGGRHPAPTIPVPK